MGEKGGRMSAISWHLFWTMQTEYCFSNSVFFFFFISFELDMVVMIRFRNEQIKTNWSIYFRRQKERRGVINKYLSFPRALCIGETE